MLFLLIINITEKNLAKIGNLTLFNLSSYSMSYNKVIRNGNSLEIDNTALF